MIEIIPAIMPESLDDLKAKMGRMKDVVPLVQLDIMDGVFVPPKTWPYTTGGPQEFSVFSGEKKGFPYWEEIDYEVDLMVTKPEDVLDNWISAGTKRIIVHVESVDDMDAVIADLTVRFKDGKEFDGGVVEFGIAINTDTAVEMIEEYLESVDFIQCMGIARIGYQGELFDKRVLEQIRALKEMRSDLTISVDGAVHFNTARSLVEAGATRLVSGSEISKAEDPGAAIDKFLEVIS